MCKLFLDMFERAVHVMRCRQTERTTVQEHAHANLRKSNDSLPHIKKLTLGVFCDCDARPVPGSCRDGHGNRKNPQCEYSNVYGSQSHTIAHNRTQSHTIAKTPNVNILIYGSHLLRSCKIVLGIPATRLVRFDIPSSYQNYLLDQMPIRACPRELRSVYMHTEPKE